MLKCQYNVLNSGISSPLFVLLSCIFDRYFNVLHTFLSHIQLAEKNQIIILCEIEECIVLLIFRFSFYGYYLLLKKWVTIFRSFEFKRLRLCWLLLDISFILSLYCYFFLLFFFAWLLSNFVFSINISNECFKRLLFRISAWKWAYNIFKRLGSQFTTQNG